MIAATTVAESPVARVLAALDGGATSRRSIVEKAGLSEDLASAIIDQLIRTGQLKTESLVFGCPPKGCGDCGGAGPASSGCATSAPRADRPALVVLSRGKPNGR